MYLVGRLVVLLQERVTERSLDCDALVGVELEQLLQQIQHCLCIFIPFLHSSNILISVTHCRLHFLYSTLRYE